MTVIPVKRLDAAKSRLRGAVAEDRHPELVLAMVADTAAAVLNATTVAGLIVVTDDPVVAAVVRKMGAEVAADPGAGLNAALRFGADEVAGRAAHRAVLTGDLPALRPEQLDAALAGVTGRAFVPDAAGTGTVLLAVPPRTPLDPRFGPGSAAAHRASGAIPLTGDWPGLRQDVDSAADLDTVLELGAGDRTRALLRDVGLSQACTPAGCAR
ncbi:2-phospho-L-lactate guanylyltransferase [Actinoplanes ianthinogenes]|uniref:Phosphoenolpyruvate guanylyltransferase n=1 Tax=Actinoplanes ianthinogenes TaxID=122358 RepID=A0ABN6CDT4_9ACTN|nr:2-phospho-L-lactate guanylyltransferase [Actinoplanes ianthinogenes]BCJ42521.1 2-phospho-L-lactate guanylyltransferase [Actinoplanes ianthinogenes]GGQ94033.1 2-phospho-L-lactate guanylyltransferase [Actinoplanes ianthinogenes]